MVYISGSSSTLFANITAQDDEFLHCRWSFWIPVTWKQCQKYENPCNLAYPPYCYYWPPKGKFLLGGGGLGGLQRHNVHTKFRRNQSARSEVETGRRGEKSGSNKTDNLLSVEFLLQRVDVC
jgi:hypothetical protein